MKVLLVYNISHGHKEVKAALQISGFQDYAIDSIGDKYFLPNTTLWHPDLDEIFEAYDIFDRIITDVSWNNFKNDPIAASHALAFGIGENFSGIKGKPHT